MNRKKLLTLLVIGFVFFLMLGGAGMLSNWAKSLAAESENQEADDPDMPAKFHAEIDEATYLRLRNEYVAMRRGIDPDRPFDPRMRGQAIEQMENQERELFQKANGASSSSAVDITPTAGGAWSPLGPAPLTNGRV